MFRQGPENVFQLLGTKVVLKLILLVHLSMVLLCYILTF